MYAPEKHTNFCCCSCSVYMINHFSYLTTIVDLTKNVKRRYNQLSCVWQLLQIVIFTPTFQFDGQDVLVPWHLQPKPPKSKKGTSAGGRLCIITVSLHSHIYAQDKKFSLL